MSVVSKHQSFDIRRFYQFCNTLKIDTKEQGQVYLGRSLMGTQTMLINEISEGMERGIRNFVTLKCLHPSMRVLTADLRWVPIGEARVGDELVAFDEHVGARAGEKALSRKMRTARIMAVSETVKPAVTMRMANGRELICSADHRWYVKRRGGSDSHWVMTSDLRQGDEIRLVVDPWESDASFETGWFSGMMDGEGYLDAARSGCGVTVSQVGGAVFDRLCKYLLDRDIAFNIETDKRTAGYSSKLGSQVVYKTVITRMRDVFRLIGTTRACRFLGKRWWEGKELPGKRIGGTHVMIESIENGDECAMIDIETSTQTFVCEGFANHNCRQIGISTISMAFDLFWIFKHPGLQGMMVTHDEPARDQFRQILDMYYEGLPDEFRQTMVVNNRMGMLFSNRSKLSFRVAGTRTRGGGALGRSAALPFLHATEMSSWGDPEGFKSLKASLAEQNPLRFYHWESTARGFNHFYDMWMEAKRAITQKAIFISFWANQFYSAPRGSDAWIHYWGPKGRLTSTEREWVKEVKSLYGVEINEYQMAWWRWKIAEDIGDEMMMMQEFPPTENHAFIATGSQFFTANSISNGYKKERSFDKPRIYRVQVGTHFADTVLLATPEKLATLRVWEEPKPKGVYVLGADPAYGSSEWADRFCLSVWRCYSDRLVQVAEFVDPDMATYSFAWVLAYLAGAYEPCLVNLEINGPGQGVLSELQSLRRAVVARGKDTNAGRDARTLMSVTKNITSYLYRRLDSFGQAGAMHTLMGHEVKERMMNVYRDYFERDIIVVKSRGLLDEMKSIERSDGSAPAASGRSKDDRVIAAALAAMAWNDQLRTGLMTRNMTEDLVTASEGAGPGGVVDKLVANYLQKINVKIQPPNRR